MRHGCNVATCPRGRCRTTGECQDSKPKYDGPDHCTHGTHLSEMCDKCFNEYAAPASPTPRHRLIDTDSATRKTFPMCRGLLDYFPDALAEVAKVSYIGNEKHNPGEEMHHARGKSMDHADCILRHLVGRGGFDGDTRESAALAWRALALLQEELESEMGLPLPRGARV